MPDAVIQKQLTEIFYLFPEYIETDHLSSAPYIKNMNFDYSEVCPECVKNFIHILSFFSYERQISKYYDKKNLDGMLFPYKELSFPSIDLQVRTTLRDNDVLDWRTELGESGTEIEWQGNKILNDTCALVYERSKIDTTDLLIHATLFSVENAIECGGKTFCFKKKDANHSLSFQTTLKDLHAWLSENRIPQRQYKYNSKHGENGINDNSRLPDGTPAALLKCDSKQAQQMLRKAIGDINIDKNLWYFDSERKKIIYFEFQNENPQNEYHCYHLSPGDKRYNKVNLNLLRQIQNDIP